MKRFIPFLMFQMTFHILFAQAWTDMADIPVKLTFPVVAVVGTDIHVMGGGGDAGATDIHLRYKTSTNTWDTLAPVPYLAQQPGGDAVNGKIHYLGGGFPNSGTPLKKHFMYDVLSDNWDTAADIPANRVIHEVIAIQDSLYVMGGQPDKLRFERYDPSTDTWKSLNNLPDQDFWYGTVVNVNDTIYRFGGGGYLSPSDKAMRYNSESDVWVNLPVMPEELHALAGAAIGDSIYLVGGYTSLGLVSDAVWIYDVHNQSYAQGFSLPAGRNYHEVVSVGTCIYAIGGQDLTVDLSMIRHCRGDTADYTFVTKEIEEKSEFDINYHSGRLLVNLGNQKETGNALLGLYDLSGRLLHSSNVYIDESGKGVEQLNKSEFTWSSVILMAIVSFDGKRYFKKVVLAD